MTAAVPAALVFTQMVAADLPQVMEIERLAFPQPWTPGLFLHELKLSFSRLHLARTANGGRDLLGYVCWWLVGDEVHILNLAVHPDARRGGTGRALVQRVIDDATAHGAVSVSLEVRRENEAAAVLYRSLGFHPAGLRKNYYGQGEDAVIMTKDLPSAASPPA
ncbi:MAG: ribosomal protein S18-alanine N-acetyltransferase [Candidatus Binatia bacterium]